MLWWLGRPVLAGGRGKPARLPVACHASQLQTPWGKEPRLRAPAAEPRGEVPRPERGRGSYHSHDQERAQSVPPGHANAGVGHTGFPGQVRFRVLAHRQRDPLERRLCVCQFRGEPRRYPVHGGHGGPRIYAPPPWQEACGTGLRRPHPGPRPESGPLQQHLGLLNQFTLAAAVGSEAAQGMAAVEGAARTEAAAAGSAPKTAWPAPAAGGGSALRPQWCLPCGLGLGRARSNVVGGDDPRAELSKHPGLASELWGPRAGRHGRRLGPGWGVVAANTGRDRAWAQSVSVAGTPATWAGIDGVPTGNSVQDALSVPRAARLSFCQGLRASDVGGSGAFGTSASGHASAAE
mmetsp:Transcript_102890/g.327047  ORF Transcript_102890/g.327047 Transcript_102890/m.327047 type:complete len:349 (+) Transcript_102890:97-1143(+)